MLHLLLPDTYDSLLAFAGILFAFAATVFATAKLQGYLPKDAGREFAHDGKLSAGKPRGAGILFVFAFVAAAVLFAPLDAEIVIYLILIVICMMTGFLDDAAKMPWGEYKKGFLDLCVAALVAMTYLKYNSNTIELAFFHTADAARVQITIPPVIFAILIIILVWTSVNVTNCADGVDGLSGTLAIISMMTIYVADMVLGREGNMSFLILLFAVCILGYLWYNATPQRLMMGDARFPFHGTVYQSGNFKDRLPAFVYSHCAGASAGRWTGAFEGGTAAFPENSYSEKYENTLT